MATIERTPPGREVRPRAGTVPAGAAVPMWLAAVYFAAFLFDGRRPWEDTLVLSVVVLSTGGGWRSAAFLTGIALTGAAVSSAACPTYWYCLTPLALAWRRAPAGRDAAFEGFAVGFALCWFCTPFIRDGLPSNGLIPHAFGCCLSGVQWAAVARVLRATRGFPAVAGAPASALAATGCEFLQAVYGLPWVFTALALPAAPTPLAQWARWLSIFGVSFLLYLLNFLWLPDARAPGLGRWVPPLTGGAIAALAWYGGEWLAARVEVPPLPLAALVVQPQAAGASAAPPGEGADRLESLRRLTRSELARDDDVDLVIWPESACGAIRWPSDPFDPNGPDPEGLHGLFRGPEGVARKPLLLGAKVISGGTRYNSACLLTPDGGLSRHDKLVLVWLSEKLPPLLDFPWFRRHLLPAFGANAPISPGHDGGLLAFPSRDGRTVRLAVSVCYEMYFPWLPQYRKGSGADANVHLTNESWVDGDPLLSRYENWTCQYRAIETGRWQILCTTMGNSAVIDPRGVVRDRLWGCPGVLRTATASPRGGPPGASRR